MTANHLISLLRTPIQQKLLPLITDIQDFDFFFFLYVLEPLNHIFVYNLVFLRPPSRKVDTPFHYPAQQIGNSNEIQVHIKTHLTLTILITCIYLTLHFLFLFSS
jgi:hypothetical protein